MSPNKAPPSSDELSLSCAGKIFVLGEYAVLAGMPAVVAAVGPRFEMICRRRGIALADDSGVGVRNLEDSFHPASPAGKLVRFVSRTRVELVADILCGFADPHEGQGGFGASTAQFALLYRSFVERGAFAGAGEKGLSAGDWRSLWKLYRELTFDAGSEGYPPSGADLVAQWQGGVSFIDLEKRETQDLSAVFDWSNLLIFSATGQAGRKVATHDHLAALKKSGIPSGLRAPFESGVAAIRSGDVRGLGTAMDQYAEVLAAFGLEIEPTRRDRMALRVFPGVAGVKGAGAFQADAVLVLMQDATCDRAPVVAAAQARGLKLVCSGIEFQKGVECHLI